MKHLALDYGDRRVGVALSDPEGTIAFAQGFLENGDQNQLLNQLIALCEKEGVKVVVIGWPVHTDGKQGERTQITRHFADELKKRLPELKIEFFDERFTTQWAEQKLTQVGLRAKDQKKEKDSMAAQILLQTYLDGLRR
jgi:putative Holliday junction resolvase